MTTPPPFVELALTVHQLRVSAAQYIVGAGAMGQYVLRQLHSSVASRVRFVDRQAGVSQGRPVIEFRTFCAGSTPGESVIYATEGNAWLALLLAIGQSSILDVRELYASTRRSAVAGSCAAERSLTVASVPRSGTFRFRYFLFALNERLQHGERSTSPHKLYLYLRSSSNDPSSPYRLAAVHCFLNARAVHSGHHLPPGALAQLGGNPVFARLLTARAREFRDLCATHPFLAVLSHTSRPWGIEPCATEQAHYCGGYALLVRDVIDQLTSLLTVYELVLERARASGAAKWTLTDFILHCLERLRPYVFFGLEGQMPLILHRCMQEDRTFVDVVLESGAWKKLVTDHALQSYSCEWFQRHPQLGPRARIFRYEDMMADEERFFCELLEFLRGDSLSAVERAAVQAACAATNRQSMRRLEQELGHAIFYDDGLERVFETETHITDEAESTDRIRAVRQMVRSRIAARSADLRGYHAALRSELDGRP